jgi:hypothetical protein
MHEDYVAGFMAKAAELGVAPEALAKSAEDDPLAATKILGGTGAALGGAAGGRSGFAVSELLRPPVRGYTMPSGVIVPEVVGVKKPRNLKFAILAALVGAAAGATGVGVPATALGGLVDVARS